jgi:hypothetical protein
VTTTRPPDLLLGDPQVLDLPEPRPLRKMVGPGVIAVGIGMAAGEFIIWPHLTSIAGLGLLWLAIATLVVQTLINLEIERYTLATGQTVVAGFARWWKGWGVLICVAGAFQYAWPGWATSGSAVFTFLAGGGDVTWITITALVVIGVLLTASPVIYRTVEKVEFVKVGLTIFLLAVLVVAVISWQTWAEAGAATARDFGRIPDGLTFAMMLGAIGAAGAGGVHNLVISNWIRDKGYGMGAHVPRLVSPITGQEEAAGADFYTFPTDEANLARWQVWWRRANIEQVVSFFVICLMTISIMCMLAYQTLFGRDDVANDTSFLRLQGELLGAELGVWAKILFFAVGTVSLWAAALGLLDVIGRVVSDFVKRNYLRESAFWTESKIYLTVVWAEILLGSAILLGGLDQPLVLLLISTCAASVITLVYSILLIRLNRRDLPGAVRLRGARLVGMGCAVGFYGFFAVGMVVTQVQKYLF